MKTFFLSIATGMTLLMASHVALAQAATSAAPATAAPAKVANEMAEGEVRKIDKENKKITLRHGVIKSLDMPAMTMVFGVKDAAMLDNLKAGDKVKFTATSSNGALVVQSIQPAQ